MSSNNRLTAVVYIRFSSEEQAAGHSVERQKANIESYCNREGLKISETLIDEGLSAFKGHHVAKGNLGRFLAEADKGLHSGKALVVEHLDRLSRLGISKTSELLNRIHKAGIEVHITQENRVIRSSDDLLTAIMNVIGSYSGQEYSKKLRERVHGAWMKKKHQSDNGNAITSIAPAWLIAQVGKPFQIDQNRANIVRKIFELSANGLGKRLIARRLSEQKVPTFGRSKAWSQSSVGDILTNRAVLGEYQPHTGKRAERRPEGEPRADFYPAIIGASLWQRVQDTLAGRRSAKLAGRTGKVRNLFSGLVFDITNGEPVSMYYIDKGTKSSRNLSTEKTSAGKPNTVNYARFERGFLEFLDALDWKAVLDVAESEEIKAAEDAVAQLKIEIQRVEDQIARVTDLLIDTPSQTLKDRLIKLEAQSEGDSAKLQAAAERLDAVKRKHNDLLDESVVFSALADGGIETRARLREEIRRKVARIEFIAFHSPFIKGANWPEDQTAAVVHFVNGARRVIVLTATGITATGELPALMR
jgi:DNA invertase Pin-like site-specific DNA recombinase